MPVQKQLIPVSFAGGVNTKADPKQLPVGQLLSLQNGQFNSIGQIQKRYGSTALNMGIQGGGTISAGVELGNFKDELIAFDGTYLYSYLSAIGLWSNRGVAISITTQDSDIIRTSAAQQLNPDGNYLSGIEAYAAEDSRGGIHFAVKDYETGAFALSDTQLQTFGQQPKIIAFQNQLLIFYSDGGNNLYYQILNPLNPSAIGPAVIVAGDGFAGTNGFPYDVSVIGSQIVVAYLSKTTSTGAIQMFSLSSSLTKGNITVINSTVSQAINSGYHGAVSVVGDSAFNIWVSWANGLTVFSAAYSNTFVPLLSSTLIDTCEGVVLTGIESYTAQQLLLFYEVFNATPENEQVRYKTISLLGSVSGGSTIRSVGLASKAFKFSGNIFVNTSYESTLQATDFTFYIPLYGTATIISKSTPSVGGGLQTNGMCPETFAVSPGVFKFANLIAGKLVSEANTLFSLLGLNSTQLILTPSDNFINTTQANTLLIVGGVLQGYDGVSTTECGFHIYPENVLCVPGLSGSLSSGTYQYIVEFQWTDNNGQVYRSAPSLPVSVQVSSGQSVQVSGPMLRLTNKITPISIVIFRTQANGSTFNRVSSTLAPLYNSTTTDSWSFIDTMADSSALSNELDYTTGGVLANIAPPANSIITTYNNRVFLSGMSDPLLLWYSQTVVDNSNANTVPPQFCAELTIACDPRGGPITALGLLNQALIIFKETEIFYLAGNGPDATGNNSDFGDPQLITSDVGCINANSVVIVPAGLMFQSAKGIYLLDQNLIPSYIGAPVEAFNGFSITSAIDNPQDNQVIFGTSNGTSLIYDYYSQQWGTWTSQYVADCAIYNNLFTYLSPQGQVFVQNRSSFVDGSLPIYLSWETPNINFAGVGGYSRVFRFFILGTYKGPHTLNVQVAYDFNDSYTQQATVVPSPNITSWGSDPFWGISSPWGGAYQIYEFRVDCAIQKCTAIRIKVSDNQASSYNEGYAISSIIFEVGTLPGGNRLPVSNVFGAT